MRTISLSTILFGLQVISAQQLPKINTDKPNSIVDPQVWVEIHGVSIDKARAKTHRINNNGMALCFSGRGLGGVGRLWIITVL